MNGRSVGVGTIHLENRTHGPGRQAQLEVILREAEAMFPGMPVALGGDLNTNTFDGRDKDAIREVAGSPELQRRCLEDVAAWEGALPAAEAAGYRAVPEAPIPTRRKPCRRRAPGSAAGLAAAAGFGAHGEPYHFHPAGGLLFRQARFRPGGV